MKSFARVATLICATALMPCAGVLTAQAQTAVPVQTAPAAVPAPSTENAPDAFTIGPEDVLEVTVRDHPELSQALTVLPDGKIVYPTVGEMQAAGKTPRAFAAEIQTELETTLNNIRVTVTVKEIHSRRVRIVGAVRQQGGFDLKRDWRVFDLVTAAGGLSAKPELVTARIIRKNAALPLNVNLAEAMRAPQSSANIPLERDDLMLLDEQTLVHRQVQVIGQVGRPSVYDIEPETTLLQVLAQAGNPTEKAALTRAYVLRNGMQIPVNLYTFLAEGKADDNVTKFRMQSGDVVFIPALEAHYSVQGQVGKTGVYTYPEKGNVTVLDALNGAGGGASGDLSKVGIFRLTDGKYNVIPVNVDQMLKKGDLSKNVTIQPGDMVYVPAKSARHGLGFQDVLAPLSLLGIFGFHF